MLVLDFQRMSTEDGPGLRTTLFVKGCPLACKWCHNPESISQKRQVEWLAVRCIGCGECVKGCPNMALKADASGVAVNREICTVCGKCTESCPAGAIEIKGVKMSVDEVFDELIKDKEYFGKDGGVTLSGGEITLQSAEAIELLKKLKSVGIGTAVDTCGLCRREVLEQMLPYTDVFLYDVKHIDNARHRELTGAGNEQILSNLDYLAEAVKGTAKQLWVRTPIIPGATDSYDNIRGIAKYIKGKFARWEMCAFNNLCRDKYERLYLEWDYKKAQLMTQKRMDELCDIAKNEGLNEVYTTGAARL